MDCQLGTLTFEGQGHALVDVGNPDAYSGHERIEVSLLFRAAADICLDKAAQHRSEGAGLVVRVVHQVRRLRWRLYLIVSSGHSTAIRVVHSVISCEAFV